MPFLPPFSNPLALDWRLGAALHPLRRRIRSLAPGLLLTGGLAAAAIGLAHLAWFERHGIGALTLAIVLGMVVGNAGDARVSGRYATGVDFSRQRLLRLGIVLYGLRLTVQDMAQVGIAGVLIDVLMLSSTFMLALFAGTRIFRLDRESAILIGAGSAICGAAAVMATEPVLRARTEQVTVAVATVVVFGTLALFLYPLLYGWLATVPALSMSPLHYGVFVGSTIHEVAQVVAAGRAVNEQAADAAVIAKMTRVVMLAPFLLLMSAWLARQSRKGQASASASKAGIVVPWFALGFIAVALFNSTVALPSFAIASVNAFDNAILSMAMAGLGLTTRISAIRRAGLAPLALAGLLFVWLVAGGYVINRSLMG